MHNLNNDPQLITMDALHNLSTRIYLAIAKNADKSPDWARLAAKLCERIIEGQNFSADAGNELNLRLDFFFNSEEFLHACKGLSPHP